MYIPRPLVRTSALVAVLVVFGMAALGMLGNARAAAEPKAIVKCQATLKKAGAKFIGKKLGALGKCDDGIFKCIQTVDETADAGAKRTACIAKARGACLNSLGAITLARQAFVDAVNAACTALDPTQVTGADGLGYAGNDCSAFGTAVTDVATLAECLAKEHNCVASQIFQFGVPRALELLQFAPPDAVSLPPEDSDAIACLVDEGGTGADVNDVALGKGIVKCEKAIEKAGTKLASGRLQMLEKCVDALFACAQTKSGDDLAKCRAKARAGCAKAFVKRDDTSAALGASLGKPCGDAALFAALRTPAGANLNGLLPSAIHARVPVACASLVTVSDYETCLLAHSVVLVADAFRFQVPTVESLLGTVGCDLDACGAEPTPTATPTPGGNGITQILDSSGDGKGHTLDSAEGIAASSDGTVYVAGCITKNAFKIANGTITQIFDSTGDGAGHTPQCPSAVALDGTTVYVGAFLSGNVFKITAGGAITQIIGPSGDGTHPLTYAEGLAVGPDHSVYVAGSVSKNAFKITSDGTITQIIDATGDGQQGHGLAAPQSIAVDGLNTVYVSGANSSNAFKITSQGVITRIIDASGDGAGHTLDEPSEIAVDAAGSNVYVADRSNNRVFKIASGGAITQIIDSSGDGTHALMRPEGLAVDTLGNVFVIGFDSNNAFEIAPGGTVTRLIGFDGDGAFHTLVEPAACAVDGQRHLYVGGDTSNNVFRVPY